MNQLYSKLQEADSVVVASPIYWFNISAQTKIFIEGFKTLRNELIESGVIIQSEGKEGKLKFSSEYLFSSPSAASSVVMGRSSNGLVDWKDKTLMITRSTFAHWRGTGGEELVQPYIVLVFFCNLRPICKWL